ncbi:ABC-type oligopeptide transport system substrate-binding subunit [Acinetobacter calcoaceticus]|uniref:ABC-type oligopeptide transport system substrate-binding subunit n=1 Tax=Acinetobacter calcoaceticus TaxID=471 RepID=A0A4R1XR71_ACICA|nr:ABC-type oligopeptide transport system substrate-binding subunit [Acinetobacter calcoaceticus]
MSLKSYNRSRNMSKTIASTSFYSPKKQNFINRAASNCADQARSQARIGNSIKLLISVFSLCILNGISSVNAAPPKVIHSYFRAAETGFDPIKTSDLYSSMINASIYETLYSYDYLASPAKLIPQTAVALPEISADGLTYTIRIKKGIYFSPDPVFKAKKRELTAYDYAYSWKRLLDPQLRSPNAWLIEGKFSGMAQLVQQAEKSGRFNYDAPVAGLQTPDRYTLVLRLNEPDPNLAMMLAHGPTAALAKEVVEHYKNAQGLVMATPVGTGPYVLAKWTPGSRIILNRNPLYRGFIWDFKASNDPADQNIIKQMQGKKMPQIDVVDIQIIQEYETQWLAFKQKQLDWVTLSSAIAADVIKDKQLIPEVAKSGAYLSQSIQPSLSYTYWNMQDPTVGGLSPEKIALRRAIAMSFSAQKYINMLQDGRGFTNVFPVPPGIVGFDPSYNTSIPYSVSAANALLDRYGYKKGPDGYRLKPNGQPLSIELALPSSASGSLLAEFWKRNFDQLNIRFAHKSMLFPDYIKMQKQCQHQMGMQRWIADYPDAENFFQLFYSKNIHGSNFGCIKIPEFDRLYERSRTLSDGPERAQLYKKMARILEVNMVTMVSPIDIESTVIQPYVIGYKDHPTLKTPWLYIDISK